MKSSFLLAISFSALVGVIFPIPIDLEMEEDPELTGGFSEGDMELDIDDHRQRNGVFKTSWRWPNGEIYYKISNAFDKGHHQYILNAMEHISYVSCIRFHQANNDTPIYLNIVAERKGCTSQIGYNAKIRRMNLEISKLGTGCFRFGSIVHELLHMLGFRHMQSAHDRDEWVMIVKGNIKRQFWENFTKSNRFLYTNFGVEYDYGSIMHYHSTAFSKNGNATIVALKKGGEQMGQRVGMSQKDIAKLNLMYKCSEL